MMSLRGAFSATKQSPVKRHESYRAKIATPPNVQVRAARNDIRRRGRWKRQVKLEHLKQERSRLNTLYSNVYTRMAEALRDNTYPIEMLSEINIMMPKEIGGMFWSFARQSKKPQTDRAKRDLLFSVAMETKNL